MGNLRDKFCAEIKRRFPAISAKADAEYEHLWGGFERSELYSCVWFESLANALNQEMSRGVPGEEYRELFATIGAQFSVGDGEVRKAIDVAFVENLFWQVTGGKIPDYWAVLPENLKELYVAFHRCAPL